MFNTSKLVPCSVLMLLFVAAAAHAADPKQTPREPVRAHRPLDLKAPPIARIFTAQQIDMILARAVDTELEHVEVEASRIGDLPARDRSASTPEVVFKEVVRWLAPYPSALAARVNKAPDGDAYRPTPVMLSSYHASFPSPYNQR